MPPPTENDYVTHVSLHLVEIARVGSAGADSLRFGICKELLRVFRIYSVVPVLPSNLISAC